MNQVVKPQSAEWPRWNLPEGLNLFVIIVGFVVAIILPVIPNINSLPPIIRWGIPALCLIPLFLWLVRRIIKTINTAWYRIRWYSKLYKNNEQLQQEIQREKSDVMALKEELRKERDNITLLDKELRKEKGDTSLLRGALGTCLDLLQTFKVVDAVKKRDGALYLIIDSSRGS